MISAQLFQTIYVFSSLVLVLVLSAIWQKKEACTCRVKVPSTAVALITTATLAILLGNSPLAIAMSIFLVFMLVGSIIYPHSSVGGGVSYLAGYISLFASFEIFDILDIFNTGLENIVIFGALIAIILMFLKKQDNVITIYVIGMSLFFIVSILSGILPLVVATILISLSELMLIYSNDYSDITPEPQMIQTGYFSAGLYSFGILLIPLIIL